MTSLSAIDRMSLKASHKLNGFFLNNSFRGSERIRSALTNALVRKTPDSYIVDTLWGFQIYVEPVIDKGIERSLYRTGAYEAGTMSVIKSCLNKENVFLDIGANIGLMTLLASQLVGDEGKVYAFEPQPETLRLLRKNIDLNNMSNIHVMPIGVGSENSEEKMYNNMNINRGSASFIKQTDDDVRGTAVAIRRLDDIIESEEISRVDMVKIDIEGFELEALKGGRKLFSRQDAPMLCVEYSSLHPVVGGKLTDIYNTLLSYNNFSFYKIKKGKEIPSPLSKINSITDLPKHDNIFCFLDYHKKRLPDKLFE